MPHAPTPLRKWCPPSDNPTFKFPHPTTLTPLPHYPTLWEFLTLTHNNPQNTHLIYSFIYFILHHIPCSTFDEPCCFDKPGEKAWSKSFKMGPKKWKKKKSNRAVPYLYYEVEKKGIQNCSPKPKCPPILLWNLLKNAFGCFPWFWNCFILHGCFRSRIWSIFVRFSTKIWKSAIRIENLSQHFFTITSLEEVQIVKVWNSTIKTIFELPN